MKKGMNHIILTVFMIALVAMNSFGQEKYKLVQFSTEDGGEIHAAFFEAGKEKVVVFAHGAIFNKESWYFLAEKFQKEGVSALSIDFRGYGDSKVGSSNLKYYDVLGAVAYLKSLGFKEIDLIGGSMGGAAVLRALSEKTDISITKVVLLSPAGGPPIKNNTINKLIVVSKEEGLYPRVKAIFDNSSEPKELKEFEGSAHAQHMFKEKYADELIQKILDFIR